MNSFLLNRQLGQTSHQALAAAQNQRLLSALQIAPDQRFAWRKEDERGASGNDDRGARAELQSKAHAAGVNAVTIDRFEGRYLLSAGADSSIAIWDLEACPDGTGPEKSHTPLGQVKRSVRHQSQA